MACYRGLPGPPWRAPLVCVTGRMVNVLPPWGPKDEQERMCELLLVKVCDANVLSAGMRNVADKQKDRIRGYEESPQKASLTSDLWLRTAQKRSDVRDSSDSGTHPD